MHTLRRVAVVMLVGAAAVPAMLIQGHPVLSYASSGSMEPTLMVGDVFLVDPTVREPEVGDMVVFQPVLLSDQLAVHRVVDHVPEGYITRGDANPVTDQQAGEPPVPPERIRGRLLVLPSGEPVVVPGVGVAVIEAHAFARQMERGSQEHVRTFAVLALGAGVVLSLLPALHPALRRPAARAVLKARGERRWSAWFPGGFRTRHAAMVAGALLSAAIVAGSMGAHEDVTISMVVSESAPPGQMRSAMPGGVLPRELEVTALAVPFLGTSAFLEGRTAGARVAATSHALEPGASALVPVEEVAGEEQGLQEDVVRVWRYPTWLPHDAMVALHHLHAGLPNLLLGFVLLGVSAAWYVGFGVGSRPVRLLRQETPSRHRRWLP